MPILCQPDAWPNLSGYIGGPVHIVTTIEEAERALASDPHELLVVVGAAVEQDRAFAFASSLRLRRPDVGVVLVRDRVDVATLTKALQAGVREVVPSDALNELAEACARSRALSQSVTGVPATVAGKGPSPRREGKVITVFSAKGGCGKTTLAVNLSCALAVGGAHTVCLIDLDLAFGDVAINLQLDPVRTIVDAVAMAGRLDETGTRSLLTQYRPNMSVLLAPVSPGDAEKVPPALVAEILAVLSRMFDYVVVDTPSQFSEHVLNAMDVSERHVLLTTPDVPALKNLRLTLDMLDLLSYPHESRAIVLNRSDSRVGLTAADVQRVVRSPIDANVPSSRDVPISINKGTPIIIANPHHPVSTAIDSFAHTGLVATPPISRDAAGPAKQRAFGRLRKGRR